MTAQNMPSTVDHRERIGAVERSEVPQRGRRAQLRSPKTEQLAAGKTLMDEVERELWGDVNADHRRLAMDMLTGTFLSLAEADAPDYEAG